MNIAVLDDYQGAIPTLSCFDSLRGHDVTVWNDHVTDIDQLAARLANTEVLVLIRERSVITAELLERLPRLQLISQFGVTPHIDVAACTRLGITVCSGQFPRPSYATAEFTWGLILSSVRHIPQEVAGLKQGGWQSTLGTVLHGTTLGIYGYGKIGKLIANYGKAFGMRVLVWGRETTLAKALADGYDTARSKQEFLEQSDVLSLHMRLTDATRGALAAEDLARMKPTALLVNTSRAELIAPGALVAALKAGRPGHAAVDVYEQEPVRDANHPLLALDNALCTPHLGHVERDAYEFGFGHAFRQVLAWAAASPENVVNPEVLSSPQWRGTTGAVA
jgi:D-3-phosphoglycerate dehydrogenase